MSGLRTMVINRLMFNSMFDPVCKHILTLQQDKFDTLFGIAQAKLDKRAEEIRKEGFSMGKRGCDNLMINEMKIHCIDVDYEGCTKLMDENNSQ